jgi:DNA polymerase-3 subunit epsilon
MSLLAGAHLVVIDTETTGMSPHLGHALIEIARVDIVDGSLGESWSSLVQPGRSIPADAVAVHGITDAMMAEAPPVETVAAELARACAGAFLVFHNAAFDLPFLQALMKKAGLPPLYHPVLDTFGLARGLLKGQSHALKTLATQFGLQVEASHRALGDALSTARLFLALAARWEAERGIHSLAELAAASQDALRQPRRQVDQGELLVAR